MYMPSSIPFNGSGQNEDSPTLVETTYGKVQGVREGLVSVWRGIPYARSTAGTLRFRPPQPPVPWDGVLDATKFGPICPQVNSPLSPTDGLVQSEDCLNLNIWSPAADDKRRPVLVWIHGGAFVFGSGQSPSYDGSSFAAEGDVVVDPNTDEIPNWPEYDLDHRPTMLFNTEPRVENDPYGEERQVWESVFGV